MEIFFRVSHDFLRTRASLTAEKTAQTQKKPALPQLFFLEKKDRTTDGNEDGNKKLQQEKKEGARKFLFLKKKKRQKTKTIQGRRQKGRRYGNFF